MLLEQFLALAPTNQMEYFQEAALRRDLLPLIIEKDFWVCWLLRALFDSEYGQHLVFKGGTSLSKVFGAIERFSEDIDLSLSPRCLGISEPEPTADLSRNQANKWMTVAEIACARKVEEEFLPALERVATVALPGRAAPWFAFEIDEGTHSPVLKFRYPTLHADDSSYIKPWVKLEFGSLTDQRPTERHPIAPWLAEEFPQALENWRCEVVALELGRSFWEKATILHAEHHRPLETPLPWRMSRHYADLAALAARPVAEQALADDALRDRVVRWKTRFFGSAWARYDLAVTGTFKLNAPHFRLAELRGDYTAMRQMFFREPQSFEAMMATLSELEARINGRAG
jgi:hypothetical protein